MAKDMPAYGVDGDGAYNSGPTAYPSPLAGGTKIVPSVPSGSSRPKPLDPLDRLMI